MFETIRKPGRAKGLFAWIIFGSIAVVFIFIGNMPNDPSLSGGGPAAVVNSKPIPVADFLRQVEQIERRLQFDLNQLPAQQRQELTQRTRSRALETLIQRELVAQSAFESGIVVPDAQLRDVIQNYPVFQEDGRFMRERYQMFLRQIQKSPKDFEEQMRRDIAVQTMQGLFVNGLVPVKGEEVIWNQLRETKMNVEVLEFTKEDVQKGIQVSHSEAQKFLSSEANLAAATSFYNSNIEKYRNPEQVKASHILIAAEEGDAEAEKVAKEKIAEIQDALKNGTSFSSLARTYSDDKPSAKKGGDLGYFTRGRMVPEFETAAFRGEIGKVSAPIRTQYGYHLVKVEAKKPESTTGFDEVKVSIAKEILAKDMVDAEVEKIKAAVKDGKLSALKRIAQKLNLEWKETGNFDLSQDFVPVLSQNEKLMEVALSLNEDNTWHKQVVTLDGSNYVLHSKRVKPDSKSKGALQDDPFLSRSGEIFNRWIQDQRSLADVRTNNSLISSN